MKNYHSTFINDLIICIPYSSLKEKINIIHSIERKRKKGYIIKGFEVDDSKQCIMWREPNSVNN